MLTIVYGVEKKASSSAPKIKQKNLLAHKNVSAIIVGNIIEHVDVFVKYALLLVRDDVFIQ
jgi:hypothetical protein